VLARRPRALDMLDAFRELFLEGGITTTTMLMSTDDAPAIRSLVQADGDVIVSVRDDALAHPAFEAAWRTHWDSIHERLAVLPRTTARLRLLARGTGVAGTIFSAFLALTHDRHALLALAFPALCFVVDRAGHSLARLAIRVALRRVRRSLTSGSRASEQTGAS
jgi:hypothetical protein